MFNIGEKIYICRKSDYWGREKKVVLLLITDGENRHYTSVMNLSRLLSSMNGNHKSKQEFCFNCLQGFASLEKRDNHFKYCKDIEAVKVEMPKEGSILKYEDSSKQLRVPFAMYFDFESILETIDNKVDRDDKDGSYTKKINKHTLVFAFIASLPMVMLKIH